MCQPFAEMLFISFVTVNPMTVFLAKVAKSKAGIGADSDINPTIKINSPNVKGTNPAIG